MSIADEARAEAERLNLAADLIENGEPFDAIVVAQMLRKAASRKPEAAPSDTDLREAMEAALKRVSFRGNGEEIGTEEVAVMVEDAIAALLPLFSQPVQVEVTDATLQRLREAVYAQTANHTYLSIEQAENVLAALGGGEQ